MSVACRIEQQLIRMMQLLCAARLACRHLANPETAAAAAMIDEPSRRARENQKTQSLSVVFGGGGGSHCGHSFLLEQQILVWWSGEREIIGVLLLKSNGRGEGRSIRRLFLRSAPNLMIFTLESVRPSVVPGFSERCANYTNGRFLSFSLSLNSPPAPARPSFLHLQGSSMFAHRGFVSRSVPCNFASTCMQRRERGHHRGRFN